MRSIIAFPEDYVVIDLETTGLSPDYDKIIELAAVKVSGGQIVDTFQSLINPQREIDPFISQLTGITNEMVSGSPVLSEKLPDYMKFIGNSVVVGHNVVFDLNFLNYEAEYVDTMRLYRKLFPEREHHRLIDMVSEFNISTTEYHRALADCISTYHGFEHFRQIVNEKYPSIDDFRRIFKKKSSGKVNANDIVAQTGEFDETHPLFGKACVFTGTLEKMTRKNAMQAVVDLGGICENNVTQNTNYLILGNMDYSRLNGDKSQKVLKAEKYALKGQDISIIPEGVFYDLIDKEM